MAKTSTTKDAGKKLDVYPNAAAAIKGAQKRGEPSITFKLGGKQNTGKARSK